MAGELHPVILEMITESGPYLWSTYNGAVSRDRCECQVVPHSEQTVIGAWPALLSTQLLARKDQNGQKN